MMGWRRSKPCIPRIQSCLASYTKLVSSGLDAGTRAWEVAMDAGTLHLQLLEMSGVQLVLQRSLPLSKLHVASGVRMVGGILPIMQKTLLDELILVDVTCPVTFNIKPYH